MLAHRQDEIPPPFAVRRFQVAALDAVEEQVGDGQAHGVVGHVGQELRALHDTADVEAVVHRRQDRHAVALAAQEGHQPVAVHGRIRGGQVAAHAAGDGVGRFLHDRLGELQVALQQEAQVRAVATEEREEDLSRARFQRRTERLSPITGRRVAQPVDAGLGLVRVVGPQPVEPASLGGQGQNARGRRGSDDQLLEPVFCM